MVCPTSFGLLSGFRKAENPPSVHWICVLTGAALPLPLPLVRHSRRMRLCRATVGHGGMGKWWNVVGCPAPACPAKQQPDRQLQRHRHKYHNMCAALFRIMDDQGTV